MVAESQESAEDRAQRDQVTVLIFFVHCFSNGFFVVIHRLLIALLQQIHFVLLGEML
jgi:hypothetical protein